MMELLVVIQHLLFHQAPRLYLLVAEKDQEEVTGGEGGSGGAAGVEPGSCSKWNW